jgi:hypothetical protein
VTETGILRGYPPTHEGRMKHDGHLPSRLTAPRGLDTLAYRLGRPRFVHRDVHYLSIPVVCRRDNAGLLAGAALQHAREWLEARGVDPSTPDLLDEGLARLVDLEWPHPFRNCNPASADLHRLAFGWRYLIEFAAGDMLAAAVRWNRLGGGRLVPLAELR